MQGLWVQTLVGEPKILHAVCPPNNFFLKKVNEANVLEYGPLCLPVTLFLN